ncbi:MAG: replicative DNA helicase [Planctomycetota bacterium]
MSVVAERTARASERQMPHNLEAEAGVLGCLLLYPDRADFIRGSLEADDFYSEPYGAVFQAILDMTDGGRPVDPLTLREELDRRQQLDLVGGAAAIAELSSSVPNSANLEYYADIVRNKAKLRRLIQATTELLEESYRAERSADDMADWAEHLIFEISERGARREAALLKDVVKAAYHELETLSQRGEKNLTTGLATDYHELDRLMAGLHKSEFIVIAGRPSMGKTTLALNLLARIGVEQKVPSALFTLEMSKENIARNMLCATSRVNGERMRSARLSQEDWGRLIMGSDRLSQAPVYIDDTPAITLGELRGKCRRLRRQRKVELVIVDYLQLMQGPGRAREPNRQQEISEISRGLKAIARELDIPVVALSQLNRAVEGRADHKPILSDLRESGAIEQDADVVLLLHRPSYYNEGEDEGLVQVIIAKQRNGPTGVIKLTFISEQLRFENLSAHAEEA